MCSNGFLPAARTRHTDVPVGHYADQLPIRFHDCDLPTVVLDHQPRDSSPGGSRAKTRDRASKCRLLSSYPSPPHRPGRWLRAPHATRHERVARRPNAAPTSRPTPASAQIRTGMTGVWRLLTATGAGRRIRQSRPRTHLADPGVTGTVASPPQRRRPRFHTHLRGPLPRRALASLRHGPEWNRQPHRVLRGTMRRGMRGSASRKLPYPNRGAVARAPGQTLADRLRSPYSGSRFAMCLPCRTTGPLTARRRWRDALRAGAAPANHIDQVLLARRQPVKDFPHRKHRPC